MERKSLSQRNLKATHPCDAGQYRDNSTDSATRGFIELFTYPDISKQILQSKIYPVLQHITGYNRVHYRWNGWKVVVLKAFLELHGNAAFS